MSLESEKADLRERFPGWQVWYVPNATGPPTWCARPEPVINVGSPDELVMAIEQAERELAYRLSGGNTEGMGGSGGSLV